MQNFEPNYNILLIEDDIPLSYVIQKKLERIGFYVTVENDGESGLEQALTNKYSLIILDISLPSVSGFKIVEKMKDSDMSTPTIVITSSDEIEKQVRSFEKGANIFHRKPIDFKLFEAQIKSLLKYQSVLPPIIIGDLYIEPQKRYVRKSGVEVRCSTKEFKLINAVVNAKGNVLSRQDLLAYTFKGIRDLEEGSVDTLICRVRKKLGKYKGREVIETVHGEGYRLNLRYVDGY